MIPCDPQFRQALLIGRQDSAILGKNGPQPRGATGDWSQPCMSGLVSWKNGTPDHDPIIHAHGVFYPTATGQGGCATTDRPSSS
jgi:hypothetical protein